MHEKTTPEQREIRALKNARVEDARERVRQLENLRAILDAQIADARLALTRAERDAT